MVPPANAAAASEPEAFVPRRRYERERAARKQAEALLTAKSAELFDALQTSRTAERRLQLALWGSGEGVWEWRADDGLLRVDGLWLDGSVAALPPLTIAQFLRRAHPDDRAAFELAWQLHFNGARADLDAACRVRAGGRWRWIRVRGRALEREGSGRPVSVYGTVKDVTDQREAQHALHLMAEAFSSTLDALVVVDERWHIVQANESFRMLAGLDAAPHDEPLADYLALPQAARDGGAPWVGESRLLRRAGPAVAVEVSMTVVAEQAGQGQCHIVVMRDISERQRQAAELQRLAREDALTGLPNRSALEAELAQRLADARPFALLFLDLDGFKEINDGFGHGAGDALLQQIGERLTRALPTTFVARWGGDEFVVLGAPGSGQQELAALMADVRREIGQPTLIDGHAMQVTPSIGAVLCPEHGDDVPTLLRRADAAMYAAKAAGRDEQVLFHDGLDEGTQRRTLLQALLRADAARDAFHFVAQPKVDVAGRHVGAELLMRWAPAAIGPVSPAEFIPLAEQIGVIDQMGRLALRAAARTAGDDRVRAAGVPVAVNLSPRQLLRPDFEQVVMDACDAEGCDPAWVELELTESALIADVQLVEALLHRLRERGFRLALDDFGTGYSSLSHLRRFPFHKVKIDRSFVKDLDTDPRSALVLDGIVRLCRSVGLATVAEGVETVQQFDQLRAIGVDEFQGYLFGRPQPIPQWVEALGAA